MNRVLVLKVHWFEQLSAILDKQRACRARAEAILGEAPLATPSILDCILSEVS
jgi:hypothetical protein